MVGTVEAGPSKITANIVPTGYLVWAIGQSILALTPNWNLSVHEKLAYSVTRTREVSMMSKYWMKIFGIFLQPWTCSPILPLF